MCLPAFLQLQRWSHHSAACCLQEGDRPTIRKVGEAVAEVAGKAAGEARTAADHQAPTSPAPEPEPELEVESAWEVAQKMDQQEKAREQAAPAAQRSCLGCGRVDGSGGGKGLVRCSMPVVIHPVPLMLGSYDLMTSLSARLWGLSTQMGSQGC